MAFASCVRRTASIEPAISGGTTATGGVAGGIAAGTTGGTTGGPTGGLGGDAISFGGNDHARMLLLAALGDLRIAVRHLARGNDAGTLCRLPCPASTHPAVCSMLSAATDGRRRDAVEILTSEIQKISEVLNRSFDGLFVQSLVPLFIDGARVTALTEYASLGTIRWDRAEVITSSMASLGLIKLTMVHEALHKIRSRFGDPFLRDLVNIPPAFPERDGGWQLANLAGACLAAYSETHNQAEVVVPYLSRGTGQIVEARYDRAAGVVHTAPRTDVMVPLGAVSVKLNGGAAQVYFQQSFCVSGQAAACPTTHIIDAAVEQGSKYHLSADGRILDSQGNAVHSDPKLRSLAYDGETWFLLRSDGTVLTASDPANANASLEVVGLILPAASRLVAGSGPAPYTP